MGLGLYLRATPRIANPLDVIEHYLRTRCEDVLEGVNVAEGSLSAALHPAAEDVEFVVDAPNLTVSAKTSTVGPGYHAYLCNLLQELGSELGDGFRPPPDEEDDDGAGDETGYFASGDRAALEDEMLAWLRGLAETVSEHVAQGTTGIMISMSTESLFDFDGVIATPMGPRSVDWLEMAKQDPRAGIDVFPWWSSGLGAQHALGRALVRMWAHVRWRAPVDDEEQALLEKIDRDLRRAHELDATLALPWAEWASISGWLERDDALAQRIRQRAAGLTASIGYRRRPVRVSLTGGWSVRIAGEMTSSFEEDGTWCGFMPGRTVWMTSFSIGDPENPTRSAAETLPSKEPRDPRIELLRLPEGYVQRGSLGTTDEGDTRLTVEVALPHRLALFTFILDDHADLEWARETASSIRG